MWGAAALCWRTGGVATWHGLAKRNDMGCGHGEVMTGLWLNRRARLLGLVPACSCMRDDRR